MTQCSLRVSMQEKHAGKTRRENAQGKLAEKTRRKKHAVKNMQRVFGLHSVSGGLAQAKGEVLTVTNYINMQEIFLFVK
jgi:hypothetical protein